MKKVLLFVSSLIFLSLFLSSFRDQVPTATPASEIKATYAQNLERFVAATRQLNQQAKDLDEASVASLQQALRRTRLRFKRTEFLAEYLDGEFVRDFINGAPLPKLERNAPSLSVVHPKGLQVLEELIFGDDPVAEKEEIIRLASLLEDKVAKFSRFQQPVPLTDRQVFEAVRFELIRIFTLGVIGFDSPAALLSLPEAKVATETLAGQWPCTNPCSRRSTPKSRSNCGRPSRKP